MEQVMGKYRDIIFMPRPVSQRHRPMSQLNRAAQFAPFAALTGYEEAVKEEGRRTESRLELDEDRQNRLNCIIMRLSECDERPFLSVTYFCPDKNKSGGEYVTLSGNFRRIEEESMELIFVDGRRVPVLDIYDIEGEVG
ncbi:MAG: hypothetical protein HDT44_03925 [Ruminococcaceae bacterium]|nr:hypothetical protein [Oscillospiraceae bacterium]